MPLVFVHGVATRQSPAYQVQVKQRRALFERLVLRAGDQIFDPDWGSHAVTFAKGGWVPIKGTAEPFPLGTRTVASAGRSVAAAVAPTDLGLAVDVALSALLAKRAAADQELTDDDLRVFQAAVEYLEERADPSSFSGEETDAQFVQALESELKPLLPQPEAEAMGIGDVFSSIRDALKWVTDPIRNASSDAVLKVIREPLSKQVALFLGDIFVYLRWRETDGAAGTFNRIFRPIIDDLAAANSAAGQGRQLILVCHSLGAVILYDLLTDPRAVAAIEAQSNRALQIDAWVTVGAQPGLFADMGLYDRAAGADGRLPKPACVAEWMNVYDYTDILSFTAKPFFAGVRDYEFDNVAGALEAHSAYFQRPSFYKRLRERLGRQ